VGAKPQAHCAATSARGDEPSDAWPADADDDQDVDIGDVISLFIGIMLNTAAYSPRSDFNGDGRINMTDVIMMMNGFGVKIGVRCV
jgi:hypothetical protein